MVLRRLHSTVGSGPSFLVPESVRSAHLPALSTHVAMVSLPSHYRVLGVSGLQNPRSCSRSYNVEPRHG